MTTLRLLLADDHALFRAGLRLLLQSIADTEVVAEAGDGHEAIALTEQHRPDIVLMDISMKGRNGIEATAHIRRLLPETRVIILSMLESEDFIAHALRAGASGYLLKDMDRRRLPFALADVLDGEAAMPRQLVARLVREFRDPSPRRRPVGGEESVSRLTAREWEVLELMRDGMSTDDIAGRLFVSPATVRTHIGAIKRKLRVPDREAAVRLFEEST